MTFVDRYVYLRESLIQLIQTHKPDKVGIEYPVFGDLYSEGMYGLFLYSSEALKLCKKDVVFFSPGQIKAHARVALGRPDKWKMMKPDMVEAAKVFLGSKKSLNHNEADAFWCAVVAGRFWQLFEGQITESDLTTTEAQQFLGMHTFQRGKRAGQTVKSGISFRENERFFLWSQVPQLPTGIQNA